ncbi:hypothetical protein M758_4G004700 [Ceratodon purpureus]|nr:hypothetical protein M758_4G004700 [Ceratodon purpureus]
MPKSMSLFAFEPAFFQKTRNQLPPVLLRVDPSKFRRCKAKVHKVFHTHAVFYPTTSSANNPTRNTFIVAKYELNPERDRDSFHKKEKKKRNLKREGRGR